MAIFDSANVSRFGNITSDDTWQIVTGRHNTLNVVPMCSAGGFGGGVFAGERQITIVTL
jgi:hypothetical protein